MLFGVILALCLIKVLLHANGTTASQASIRSNHPEVTVNLWEPQELTFETEDGGYNIVTIKDGKIAVTAADCPAQYCVRQGFCNSGEQIVCLPHKLVISFIRDSEIDGFVG